MKIYKDNELTPSEYRRKKSIKKPKRKKKSNKKGHTYEQIYGKNKAQEIKEKLKLNSSRYWLDKKRDKETMSKIAEVIKKKYANREIISWNKGLTKETSLQPISTPKIDFLIDMFLLIGMLN